MATPHHRRPDDPPPPDPQGRDETPDGRGRLGLVLSGGGAFGAFEVGVIAELRDRGMVPDVVSGTSAGALNAGALAAGIPTEELEAAWRDVRPWQVARPRLDLWRLPRPAGIWEGTGIADRILGSIGWSHLLDTTVQRDLVTRVMGGDAITDPLLDIAIPAVDIADGTVRTFTTRHPPFAPDHADYVVADPIRADHLLASSAIPLLFSPVRVDGREYWDGGVVSNTPLAPAIHFGADRLIVVKAIDVKRPAEGRSSLGHAAAVLIDTLFDHVVRTDLKLASARNRLGEFHTVSWKVIEPAPDELTAHLGLDFGARTDRLIESGRERAAEVLDTHEWTSSFP